jgi:16S rRNA processing protein RimM
MVGKGRQKRSDRRVLLGEIAGAHGIRGAVRITTHTAEPERIAAYGPLEDETGGRTFALTVEHVTAKGVIARIQGIADRSAAEKLKGVKLYIGRARLPATQAEEFYHADLVGLEAVDAAGSAIGEVTAVVNFGAGDLLEIRRPGSRKTELVPFTGAFVPEVDLANERIVVLMPADVEEEP